MIARGDLETFVDKSSNDEIGTLAQHLDVMRRSIKRLFAELRESKGKLEEYSQTLEQKVEVRTRKLARSVEELKALGEVSQAVSSILDLEMVLTNIIRIAVQLSKTDTGTIYEFDEAKGVFIPRINYGERAEYVEALRESKLRVGDGTVIGQASEKRAPEQVPDLAEVPEEVCISSTRRNSFKEGGLSSVSNCHTHVDSRKPFSWTTTLALVMTLMLKSKMWLLLLMMTVLLWSLLERVDPKMGVWLRFSTLPPRIIFLFSLLLLTMAVPSIPSPLMLPRTVMSTSRVNTTEFLGFL